MPPWHAGHPPPEPAPAETEGAPAPPDWERRRQVAEETFVPWIDAVFPLRDATVLEYGCGRGAVAAAFAPHVRRHLGVDIDGPAVRDAQRLLRRRGAHAELQAVPLDRILGEVEALRGEIDVFLCYAVLEHMDVDERLELLALARETVRPDGVIVVVETPNRLLPWDHHTSQLPFMYQLPDELAMRWWDRSARTDYLEAMREASDRGPDALREAFVRWGRGMSHHELELALGDLRPRALACGWEPGLLGERDIHREELVLQQTMDAATPDVPPSFSRYWLDVVLAVTPRDAAPRHLRPWPLRTLGSHRVQMDVSGSLLLGEADSRLVVELPAATSRLAVGAVADGGDLQVIAEAADGRTVEVPAPPAGDRPRYVELRLPAPADRVEVRLGRPGWISFVGYEG